jgi:uncharacterized protein YdbL (DUF1318 family)
MKKILQRKIILCLLLFFLFSCVTVNIYFPAKEVEQAADTIVEDVRGVPPKEGQKPAIEQPSGKEGQSSLRQMIHGALSVTTVMAQEAASVSNPTIRALKQAMKQRYPSLQPFFSRGNIGESNAGLVEVRSTEGLSLQDKGALQNLVAAENRDRESLYAEVAKALNIDPSLVSQVKQKFAESWQRSCSKGWWIQQPDGSWVQK